MRILDGKAAAAALRQELALEIARFTEQGVRPPGLAVVLAGDDPASRIYVRNKQKACEEVGIRSIPHILPGDISQKELVALLGVLDAREDVDGILLQLPLPGSLNAQECIMAIDPQKDADGFHPLNMGKLVLDEPGILPCTPAGVLWLLEYYGFTLDGARAVVVGRSNIVGKPLALLLARKNINATVTLCHSGTRDLKSECQRADFLFLAMGRPACVGADMIREGCVVVDIGINRTPDGLCGDADFATIKDKAAAITPVPGGVGPMTIAMLLRNTVLSWKKRMSL